MSNATVTYPSVSFGSLTFTAKRWGQFPTITFSDGATAGSEVVTVDSSFNITVNIQSGVSTNLQIKNAVLAVPAPGTGLGVNDLVSVSIVTGHNSNTQVAGVSAPLAGGVTAAVKASVIIGPLKFTAHTAGTAGNSLKIKFTSGATAGSEVVTDPNANGAPLQIQIADASETTYSAPPIGATVFAGSTAAQIKAAIDTWQAANTTYVDVSFVGPSSQPVSVSSASGASGVSLAGGLAAAAASVTLQGVTVTSNTNDATQNGLVALYLTGGATAGSEVVTDNADGSFTVQIQSGTSTPTQVAAALNLDTGFAAAFTATHSGGTAVLANNQVAMTGAVGPQIYAWERDQSNATLTTTFQYFAFNDTAQDFQAFNNDSTGSNQLIGSWDGTNNHFILLPGQHVYFGTVRRPGVYLKYGTGSPAFMACTVGR